MTYAENDELNRQDDNAFSVWNGKNFLIFHTTFDFNIAKA